MSNNYARRQHEHHINTRAIRKVTPPDWIVPSIEVELNADESIKYFDYKIDNEDNQFIKDHFQFIRVGD